MHWIDQINFDLKSKFGIKLTVVSALVLA